MGQRPNDLRPWDSPKALFGSELRRYREAAGLSIAGLCDRLQDSAPYSKSTIGTVERGESRPDRLLAVQADRVLDTREALTHLWDGLFKGANAVPAWFADWAMQEPKFDAIRSYEPLVVPGLLQTLPTSPTCSTTTRPPSRPAWHDRGSWPVTRHRI